MAKTMEELEKLKPQYAGTYEGQLTDLLGKIQNRPDFKYDVKDDPLYQGYKDQYVQQGKLAMKDTIGQAAALTGGYGNSYGQQVGQQAYDAYLQRLGEVIPSLYESAYGKYKDQGQGLLDQFGLLGQMRDNEYSRYQAELGNWENERAFQKSLETEEYNRARAAEQWAHQLEQDEYARQFKEQQFAYQKEQDAYARQQAEQQWAHQMDVWNYQQQQDEYNRQWNEEARDYSRQQAAYASLVKLIQASGYNPSDEELEIAGISREAAQAIADEFSYGREQDTYARQQAEEQWAHQMDVWQHQLEQDEYARQRQDDAFSYQKEQDALDRQRQQELLDYQKQQDEYARQQAAEKWDYQKDQDAYSRDWNEDARDYSRQQDAQDRQRQAYSSLAALIQSSGYYPSDDELMAAGMSRAAADALIREYERGLDMDERSMAMKEWSTYNSGSGGGYSSGGGGGSRSYGGSGYTGGGDGVIYFDQPVGGDIWQDSFDYALDYGGTAAMQDLSSLYSSGSISPQDYAVGTAGIATAGIRDYAQTLSELAEEKKRKKQVQAGIDRRTLL